MSTTIKRISLSLAKEELRELEALMKHLGESQSRVIKRGIALMYQNYMKNKKEER